MLSVAGRPFLEYFLLRLRHQGIRRVILALAHRAQVVQDYFSDGGRLGIQIFYSDPQGRQLGTGGSIKEAEELIDGEHFFAMNGDVFFEATLEPLWTHHRRSGNQATLALAQVSDGGRYGQVKMDSSGRVEAFLEKSADRAAGPCLINGGLYVFDRRILTRIPRGQDYSLERHLFPALSAERVMGAVPYPKAFFIDIGTPADYERAQEVLPSLIKS